jgi:hypothetical protein
MPNSFFGGACPTCHHAVELEEKRIEPMYSGDIMGPRGTADADVVMIALGARLFDCGDASLRSHTFQCCPQIKSPYVLHSTFLKNNSSIKLPALFKINHALRDQFVAHLVGVAFSLPGGEPAAPADWSNGLSVPNRVLLWTDVRPTRCPCKMSSTSS